MTVRDFMSRVDERILRSPIVQALASFGAVTDVRGAFNMQPIRVELPGGAVQHVTLSFECHTHPEICNLVEGDPFTIKDYGCYRFLREVLPGGDESGMTIIELGEKIET